MDTLSTGVDAVVDLDIGFGGEVTGLGEGVDRAIRPVAVGVKRGDGDAVMRTRTMAVRSSAHNRDQRGGETVGAELGTSCKLTGLSATWRLAVSPDVVNGTLARVTRSHALVAE